MVETYEYYYDKFYGRDTVLSNGDTVLITEISITFINRFWELHRDNGPAIIWKNGTQF